MERLNKRTKIETIQASGFCKATAKSPSTKCYFQVMDTIPGNHRVTKLRLSTADVNQASG